jgi:hypothetical protein
MGIRKGGTKRIVVECGIYFSGTGGIEIPKEDGDGISEIISLFKRVAS